MNKTSRTITIAIASVVAALLLPASALAEYLVPEGNSAVTQYTEGFPTGGGEKKAGTTGKKASPAQTIGAKNAKKLEHHSPEGAEVAQVAAETAPEAIPTSESSGEGGDQGSNGNQGLAPKHKSGDKKSAKNKQQPPNDSKQDEGQTAAAPASSSGDGPSGSSGLGEILAAMTGGSSGGIGLLLPLTILAALAWGLVYFLRQRKHPEPPATAKP
jgi:hypothetical protein